MSTTSWPSIVTLGPCGPWTSLKVRFKPSAVSLDISSSISSRIGLLIALWFQSKVSEHLEVIIRLPAGGGEVVAYHHAVRAGGEYERLKVAQIHLPAPADDYVGPGQHEAAQGDYLQALQRREVLSFFERRAGPGVQEIYGDRIRSEFLERGKKLDPYLPALAEAEYAAGADMEAQLLGSPYNLNV